MYSIYSNNLIGFVFVKSEKLKILYQSDIPLTTYELSHRIPYKNHKHPTTIQ